MILGTTGKFKKVLLLLFPVKHYAMKPYKGVKVVNGVKALALDGC
jgi:hypothetical protein